MGISQYIKVIGRGKDGARALDRAQAAEQRRLHAEPALAIAHGRPTKRDRRDLQKGLNARWSASIDD